MAGNPRENEKSKGFWDGGSSGHSDNSQSAGRPSGFPGSRAPSKTGIRTNIDVPLKPNKSDQGR
jgi:hypothetical protein